MAGKTNLPDIDKGAAYKHSFFWSVVPDPENNPDYKVPVDLTGYHAKIQIRKKAGDATVLAEWSTADGNVTLHTNEVRIYVPASETGAYDFNEGEYDLLLWPDTDPDNVTRLVQGSVKVSKGVTVK